jgi:serine/threonine protein kinase/WD40 repeat protein
MMSSAKYETMTRVCPICGRALAQTAPEGLCLACLLEAGIENTPEPLELLTETIGSGPAHPRFFGDYEILREVGRGGMGIVYEARQFGTRRTVALKLLSAGAFAGADAVHRFHTEAQAAARLEHPRIVPVYEAGLHDGQHYLAMRFMAGGTLSQWARTQPVDPRRAAQIIRSLAEAVAYAHQRGVLHRDLKPGNVLLDEKGEPHLADFGLARMAELEGGVTLTSAILGTAAYMPPEQAAGAVPITAGDIYGLGAILYELLTGHPPFTGASIPEILRKVQEDEPVLPLGRRSEVRGRRSEVVTEAEGGLSAEARKAKAEGPWSVVRGHSDLQTICLKCLEKDPARRYATAQDLADELHRFLNDEPILARPISSTARLWRWCRRRPAIAALSVGLVLALLGGFAGTLWQLNEAQRNAAEKRLHLARLHELNGVNLMQEGDLLRSLLWFAEALELDPAPPHAKAIQEMRMASIIAQSPQLVAMITHDGEPVADAAFSPVRDQLATVGRDRRLRLWDIPTGNPLLITDPFDELPSGVQFSPDGAALLLTSSAYSHAHLLRISADQLDVGGSTLDVGRSPSEPSAHPHSPLHYALLGTIAHLSAGANNLPLAPTFDPTGDRFLTQTAPQTLQVWNRHDAAPLGPAIVLDAPIAWMRFTDDASAIVVITQDGRISAWDWRTGEPDRTSNVELPTLNAERTAQFDVGRSPSDLRLPTSDFRIPSSLEPRPSKFASSSGRYLATMHPAYAVFVWDLESRADPPVLLRPGAPRNLVETGRDGSVSVVRDPNSTIRVRGTTGASEVSLHPSSLKENPVQAWFDETGRFVILEYTGQRAQIWDPATGLPVTPVFQSRYATNEAEYRTVRLPTLPKSEIKSQKSEILSGSRLDGTGGWKPIELGEIQERWNELRANRSSTANSAHP